MTIGFCVIFILSLAGHELLPMDLDHDCTAATAPLTKDCGIQRASLKQSGNR